MSLLKEWTIATDIGGDYDLFHFHALFFEEFSEPDTRNILQNFDDKDELIYRLTNYKEDKISVSNESLLQLVKRDVNEKKRICSELNFNQSVTTVFENLEYPFLAKDEFLTNAENFNESGLIQETIADHLIDTTIELKKNDWLLEAYYGLTRKPELVWYLGKPLYHSSFNPDLYFNIWKNSGDYYIGGNKVYILNDGKS